jgi:uncharacterized protein
VLKVHSRCDLACDHCYVYEHADQSWRQKPRAISSATAEMAARRIAEHAATHELPCVHVIVHGGEPLLLGYDRMRQVLTALDAWITPTSRLDLRVHTNGVLLDERWCALFDEYGVRVGVSLDGDRAANDRHRRFPTGKSSHLQVRQAISLLREPRHRHLYAGILCTIDLANDPISVYEALIAESPPHLDLLLPHATWDTPPFRPTHQADPYADWLSRVYQRWNSDGRPVPIRLFDSLISLARGGRSLTEAVGLDAVDLLVIETDGSWEQADSLKVAYESAPATGLNVYEHPVDEVTRQPGFAARQGGLSTVSGTCRSCPVVHICGGGLYAHRYSSRQGFDNPSVYCGDLKALIGRVTADVLEPAALPGPQAIHSLSAKAFDSLAAGPGSVEAVTSLAEMRLSQTRSLVAAVADGDDGRKGNRLREAARQGWALLCRLDAEQPGAVREIFLHPFTYAWAIRCLLPPPAAEPDLDRAHLAGVAAAAAVLAGATVTLPLPVRAGWAHVPTVGAAQVRAGSASTVTVSVSSGQVVVDGDDGIWHPARRLDGPGQRIQLEDLDPFRDCQTWTVADRLCAEGWQSWQRSLDGTGSRLALDLPAYARAIGAGLRTVVPLRGDPGRQRSSSASQAFGAVAVALPGLPADLDALLVHEFQHVKLHALMDLRTLIDPGDRRRLKVPWRDSPRPLGGVMHGVYAHLALAHLCRSRGEAKRGSYLNYRSWVCEAIAALSATGSLTRDGERFVGGMLTAAETGPVFP